MRKMMKSLLSVMLIFTLVFGGAISFSAPTYAATKKVYLGKFTCTAYCGCKKCNGKYYGCRTASGTKPKAGRTIAVDPKKIKLKTKVMINGRTYTAEDTGGAIKGKRIDIFFSTHSKCNKFGRKKMKVYRVYKSGSGSKDKNKDKDKETITTTDEHIIPDANKIIQEDALKEENHKNAF